MFSRLGSAGFFVRHNSWGPRTIGKVVSVGGLTDGVLAGESPCFNDPKTKKQLIVLAQISYQGAAPKLEQLSSPDTFAYTMVDQPEWWPHNTSR